MGLGQCGDGGTDGALSGPAGYCSYKYRSEQHKLEIEFTGSAETFDVQILLPPNRRALNARLSGRAVETTQRKIEESVDPLVMPSIPRGVHRIEVDLD